MIHPIRAWNAFFFGPTSARPLGLIRIGFGLVALFNLGLAAYDFDHWFSDTGLLRADEARVASGPFQITPLHYLGDPTSARVAFGLTVAAACFLTIGFRARLASILFYLGMLSLHLRNTASMSGADVLLMIFAFNLMLCPSGAAYSVDARIERRRRGTVAEPIFIPWGMRLIQIQIGLVYTMAALLKCGGNLWINGSALHHVFNNTEVRRLDFSFLSEYPILINVMTYSALTMELSLAFFIWFRAARPYVLPLGVMLHSGILVSINIPVFGELMWLGYLAFLTPPEFNALLRAVDVRRLFGKAPKPEAEVPATAPAFAATTTIRIDPPAPAAIPAPHLGHPEPDFVDEEEGAWHPQEIEAFGSYQIYM